MKQAFSFSIPPRICPKCGQPQKAEVSAKCERCKEPIGPLRPIISQVTYEPTKEPGHA